MSPSKSNENCPLEEISPEECMTCHSSIKVDKLVSNVDKLCETLANLQMEVLTVINILPKDSFVPDIQERIQKVCKSIKQQQAPTNKTNNSSAIDDRKYRRIRSVFPLGFYRRKPMTTFRKKKMFKVVGK